MCVFFFCCCDGCPPGSGQQFGAQLVSLDGTKLGQLSITDGAAAAAIMARVRSSQFAVSEVKARKAVRNPPAPFITSTLQQAAASKLGFSASLTMSLAQELYEGAGGWDQAADCTHTYTHQIHPCCTWCCHIHHH